MNTVTPMRNPAQEIAAAIDSAMKSFMVDGKPITQAELSRRSGVPQATISRTLSGKTIPEMKTLSSLISVLGENNVAIPKEVMVLVPSSQPKPAIHTLDDPLGMAIGQSVGGVDALRQQQPQSPLVVAAMRLDRSTVVSQEMKSVITKLLLLMLTNKPMP